MDSTSAQEQHSIYNGVFKKNPKIAAFFVSLIEQLKKTYDNMPCDEMIQLCWGEPIEALEKIIKNHNKREKKEKTKFECNLQKPLTSNILFSKEYKLKCDTDKIKFTINDSHAQYKIYKLNIETTNEPNKYEIEALDMKNKYNIEYTKLYNEAIASGNFPAEKPKKPLTGYFLFLAEKRSEISQKYENFTDRKDVNVKVIKDAGVLWAGLSDSDKSIYKAQYKIEKDLYDVKIIEWKYNELNRVNKSVVKQNAKPNAEPVVEEIATPVVKSVVKAVVKENAKAVANTVANTVVKQTVKPDTNNNNSDEDDNNNDDDNNDNDNDDDNNDDDTHLNHVSDKTSSVTSTSPPVNMSNNLSKLSTKSTNILNSNTPVYNAHNVPVPVVSKPDVKATRVKATSAKK